MDHRDSPLSADNVGRIFDDCLAHGDRDHPTITAQGIVHTAHFACARLAEHKDEIAGMLAQLPEPFQPKERGGGDGWSFLNACNDRDGNQWTGFHLVMEKLVMLGLATNQVKFCMDRELWEVLPGGMPYFRVVIPT
jgi:hypothetical protein